MMMLSITFSQAMAMMPLRTYWLPRPSRRNSKERNLLFYVRKDHTSSVRLSTGKEVLSSKDNQKGQGIRSKEMGCQSMIC